MTLDPGMLDSSGNFINSDCMAKDITDAINDLMPLPPNLTPEIQDDIQHKQRQLAVAFSRGIINYLKLHADDFQITVTSQPPISSVSYQATLKIN